jgi:hypothetical protein
MNVEIGAEAAQFPVKEYINGIAVAVWLTNLTNRALAYKPKCGGGGGSCGVSAYEYSCT